MKIEFKQEEKFSFNQLEVGDTVIDQKRHPDTIFIVVGSGKYLHGLISLPNCFLYTRNSIGQDSVFTKVKVEINVS